MVVLPPVDTLSEDGASLPAASPNKSSEVPGAPKKRKPALKSTQPMKRPSGKPPANQEQEEGEEAQDEVAEDDGETVMKRPSAKPASANLKGEKPKPLPKPKLHKKPASVTGEEGVSELGKALCEKLRAAGERKVSQPYWYKSNQTWGIKLNGREVVQARFKQSAFLLGRLSVRLEASFMMPRAAKR